MHVRSACLFFLFGIVWQPSVPALEETSFRMRSLGSELAWVLADSYTDIHINPAAIAGLSEAQIFTNLSNLRGADHQILKGEDVAYSGSAGAFHCGTLFRWGDWGVGIMGDQWRSEQWEDRSASMSTDFSRDYRFGWRYQSGQVGTYITDHNTDTISPADDYRTITEYSGANVTADDYGTNLKLVLGKERLGFTYEFSYMKSAGGTGFSGEMRHALLEVGHDAPVEAVEAIQWEANDRNYLFAQHSVILGAQTSFKEKGWFDLVGGFYNTHRDRNHETRRFKQIDYDPDHDGEPHESSYYEEHYSQYDYQYLSIEDEDLSGWGGLLRSRGSWKLNRRATARLFGSLDYRSIATKAFLEEERSEEHMLAFPDGEGFESADQVESKGTSEERRFLSRLGLGFELRPERQLTIGIAAAWRYALTEHLLDAVQQRDSGTEPLERESRDRTHELALPLGAEYMIKKKYALRLGTLTRFSAEKHWMDEHRTSAAQPVQTEANLHAGGFRYSTTTTYSYGVGLCLTDHIHVDVTGITDLSEIEEFLLSFVYHL